MLTVVDVPRVRKSERVHVTVLPGYRVDRHEDDGTVTRAFASCVFRAPVERARELERAGAIKRKRRRR